MQIKEGMQEEYEQYKKTNAGNPYSGRVVSYGEDWARLMEEGMGDGSILNKELMDRTSHAADTDGITGFMYGAAAKALAHFWVYGAAFQPVFNAQYMSKEKAEALAAKSPGATVNPAIVTVGE